MRRGGGGVWVVYIDTQYTITAFQNNISNRELVANCGKINTNKKSITNWGKIIRNRGSSSCKKSGK